MPWSCVRPYVFIHPSIHLSQVKSSIEMAAWIKLVFGTGASFNLSYTVPPKGYFSQQVDCVTNKIRPWSSLWIKPTTVDTSLLDAYSSLCSTVSGGTLASEHQSLRLLHDSIFVRLPAINWQFCFISGWHNGGRAFADAGPWTWNSPPKHTTPPPSYSSTSVFGHLLKIFLFLEY